LENLAQQYLGVGKQDAELEAWIIEKFGKKNPKSQIWRTPPEIVAPYAVADVDLPLRIFKLQKVKLEEAGLWPLFILESKLIPLLLAMRQRGIKVDLDRAEKLYNKLSGERDVELAAIQKLSGEETSVWAAKELAVLFDNLGIAYPRTEKTKAPSFKAGWLEACPHPVAQQILQVRQKDKMCETFLKGCVLEGHYKGRIHCQFNQLKGEGGGTVTGRFSSSTPNLQFIPTRTAIGKELRRMFLPDDGQIFWKKDYSQIEYRLLVNDAAEAKFPGAEEVALKYKTDPSTDFHKVIADMTGLDRSRAKTVNFGIAYGEGLDKLARSLHLSKEDALELLNQYHTNAPFLKPLANRLLKEAAKDGFVKTLFGRMRRCDMF